MNRLVRITVNDDGDAQDTGHLWHLVDPANGQGDAALCTGEFFGHGESRCEYEIKTAARGGITCPECLAILRLHKAVKL